MVKSSGLCGSFVKLSPQEFSLFCGTGPTWTTLYTKVSNFTLNNQPCNFCYSLIDATTGTRVARIWAWVVADGCPRDSEFDGTSSTCAVSYTCHRQSHRQRRYDHRNPSPPTWFWEDVNSSVCPDVAAMVDAQYAALFIFVPI